MKETQDEKARREIGETTYIMIAVGVISFVLGWNPFGWGVIYDEPVIDNVTILNVEYERFYHENEYYYRSADSSWRWLDSSFEQEMFPGGPNNISSSYDEIMNKQKKIAAERLINEVSKTQ
tara:strand:- start:212 stop:574 length:363 start_codon:yes stop_codon:yes gene_type:complete